MLEDPPRLTIRRTIPRPSAEDLAAFAECITGWLADAQDGRGALDAAIKPLDPTCARTLGPALTCWCGPNDNLALLGAIAVAQAGDVIVCACEGFTGAGMAGDITLGMARNKGVAAVITDGMVRDRDGVVGLGLPVFARGVTPNSCVRNGPGTVGLPITCAGLPIASGDLVLGDRDGVVIVPRGQLATVAAGVAAIRAAEAKAEAAVRAGLQVMDETTALLQSSQTRWVD